jgi:predicted MFS family arabinose efflux permease
MTISALSCAVRCWLLLNVGSFRFVGSPVATKTADSMMMKTNGSLLSLYSPLLLLYFAQWSRNPWQLVGSIVVWPTS